MHETPTTGILSPPALVYLGMGLMTARIVLQGQSLRDVGWLARLQFLVRAGSVVLLWPLVLFLEKFESWLKDTPEEKTHA